MAQKNIVLPFITQNPTQRQELPFSAELACVVCMAESQRKKPGFLRDASEKTAYISKIYYPLWIAQTDSRSLVIDGLTATAHEFTFEEPTRTDAFIEELKKNSPYPQKLAETLKIQALNIQTFVSPAKWHFRALISNRELLTFLKENIKTALPQTQQENALIPLETDEATVAQTVHAFNACLRTLQAHQKGLQQAIDTLNEELSFHRTAAASEIERLREKVDLEVAAVRPSVDKAVKKITQKHQKAAAMLQRAFERKIATLERSREKTMGKLQKAERQRDAAQKRLYAAKRRNTSFKSGLFSLQKYERDAENIKRDVKAVSEQLEKVTKEKDNRLGLLNMEFRSAVSQEENRINQIEYSYKTKAAAKQNLIAEMTTQAAAIMANLQSRIDELKRGANALKTQVEIDWSSGDPDELVLVQVPIYLIKYTRNNEERHSFIFPIAVSADVGVMKEIKKILSINPEPKLKVLVHPANAALQDTFSANLLVKMQNDVAFRMKLNEVSRSSNLTDLNNFGQILNEGLDEIERLGWINHEEAATMCRRVIGETA
jgi:hypothetical protein